MLEKFDMVTTLGGILDITSDFTKFSLFFHVLYLDRPKEFIYFIQSFIPLLVGCLIHMGTQEKYFNNLVLTPVGITQYFGINPNYLRYTKYFGCGTLLTYVAIYMNARNIL